MALILPTQPLPGMRPSVVRLARACRKLPDDVNVRLGLGAEAGRRAPSLVLQRGNALLALWVWDASEDEARTLLQGQTHLFASGNSLADKLAAIPPPPADTARAHAFREAGDLPEQWKGWQIFGKEVWRDPTPLMDGLRELSPARVPEVLAELLPDRVVPRELTVAPPTAGLSAALAPALLDLAQEIGVMSELRLPEGERHTAENLQARVITGVAGSGKSLVLLYRLRLMRRHFPKRMARALVLTHNRALIHDLRDRYARIAPEDAGGPRFATFMEWCFDVGRPFLPGRSPLGARERRDKLAPLFAPVKDQIGLSLDEVFQEIDWLKDLGLPSRDAYMTLSRSGQGTPLRESQRAVLYDLLERYQESLRASGDFDWGDVPLIVLDAVRRDACVLPAQDLIFLDETQFFAPVWFELIRAALHPRHGLLSMAADPTQGFLRRRQSWRSMGFEVRGQARRLEKSYRNARGILEFATLFYRQRCPGDPDALLAENLDHLVEGALPILLPLRSTAEEFERVTNELTDCLAGGMESRDLLVIGCESNLTRSLRLYLQRRLGADRVGDPRLTEDAGKLRVISLDAVTGLEARVVFLVGAHLLMEREAGVRLSESEREDLKQQTTRKLYTAATRAGERLVITYAGPVPPEFLQNTTVSR